MFSSCFFSWLMSRTIHHGTCKLSQRKLCRSCPAGNSTTSVGNHWISDMFMFYRVQSIHHQHAVIEMLLPWDTDQSLRPWYMWPRVQLQYNKAIHRKKQSWCKWYECDLTCPGKYSPGHAWPGAIWNTIFSVPTCHHVRPLISQLWYLSFDNIQ